jgi:hypothetical protein
MHNFLYNWFFAAYGDGAYSQSIYGDDGSGGGSLANTGTWILLVVTAACALTFFALLVRFWHRKRKQPEAGSHATEVVSPTE